MKYDFQINNQTFGGGGKDHLTRDKFIDSNALGFGWRPGQKMEKGLISGCKIDGNGFAEGLKLSMWYDMVVKDCEIIGGREDCVDIVRGGRLTFERCRFISNGDTKQHMTIKGGVKDILIKDCVFVGNYRNWWDGACIDLGNWTDYDDVPRPFNRNIVVSGCKMENMTTRNLCRVLYSEWPQVSNCDGRVLVVPKLFVKLFFFLQRKGWVGKRRRFPESWLKVYDVEL